MTRTLTSPENASPGAGPLLPGDEEPGYKRFLSGTHRVVNPSETLARMRRFMPELNVTRIADITGLDRIGIPVAVACRPNSRNLAVSQGKGISREAAHAGALMETIELYHAETITAPLRYGSLELLKSECPLIEREGLPLASTGQFTSQTSILWIEGYDLLRREAVWLPYELVSTDFTLPHPPGSGYFQANTNGLASGNTLLEAVSQGICEAVERDALALWHISGKQARAQTRVRLDSIDDPECRKVLDLYHRAAIEVTIWNMTSDVGLAAFRCMISERPCDGVHAGYIAQGMGCHPSRPIALLRALTEAAQSRLTFIAGSRDDVFRDMYMRLRDPDWSQQRRRELRPGDGSQDFRAVPHRNAETFRADICWELQCLRAIGVQRAIVVELTKPQFRIPVVKVVIPGLEGFVFDPEYVPGARARRLEEGQK